MSNPKTFFTKSLLFWHKAHNQRQLPWKGIRDPYKIWLSEIILQQTRVSQGAPYYLKFIDNFPNVSALANASEDEVLKLWQGLGYYSRARNLHQTAKYISKELNGKFPHQYKDVLNLKGVGEYTAAAICSFAYDLPHAVIDGNVFRVLARFFDINIPIDSTEGKKHFRELAHELLHTKEPAVYNQAIMDFGATVCVPASPTCTSCILAENCLGYRANKVHQLPAKKGKIKKRIRHFNYLIPISGDFLVERREGKDVWQGLYQFPMIESEHSLTEKEINKKYNILAQEPNKIYKQTLTHQLIYAKFWKVKALKKSDNQLKVKKESLNDYAWPKIIDLYLKDNTLTLF